MRIFGAHNTIVADKFSKRIKSSDNTKKIFDFFKNEISSGTPYFGDDCYEKLKDEFYSQNKDLFQNKSKVLMLKANEAISDFYDKMGAKHDSWVANREWKKEVSFLGYLADNLDDNDKLIVDAGCASGLDICALAYVFPKRNFAGHDCSKVQIYLARERAERYGLKNVEFHHNYHLSTPFEDNSIDVLILKRYDTGAGIIKDKNLQDILWREELANINKEFLRILKNDGTHIKVISSGGEDKSIGTFSPGFEFLGSIVWPDEKEPSLNKPFDIAFFYRK